MIKQLDAATINKIAAGEVVERPFSIVKELVENSIDAGSKKIIVEIKGGGIPFIRVTDNGAGIPAEEIELAFKSHATSKIEALSDLSSLHTLGFRGEALASIAAVSQLEITSKPAAQDTGVCLEIFGGELLGKRELACNMGTSVVVRNIFYNTPVRKKFLKSVAAETGFISDFMNKIALSRPDISFRFINNGNETLYTTGNSDLKTAIFCVYGMDFTEKLVNVEFEQDGIAVGGFVGKPEISRANRYSEDMFVNGRFVKDKVIGKAAEDAFKTYLMVGRFPAFVLNIGINPKDVDVNAHPQKLEIRFADEQAVYDAVYGAVKEALKSATLIPEIQWVKEGNVKEMETLPIFEDKGDVLAADGSDDEDVAYPEINVRQFFPAREAGTYVLDRPEDMERSGPSIDDLFPAFGGTETEQTIVKNEDIFSNYTIIGQAFFTYWIVEKGAKLFIIDQHAAHERILFERFRTQIAKADIASQTLVIPEKLALSDSEKGLLDENMAHFNRLGFQIERYENEFYLKSLPIIISTPEKSETVRSLIGILSDGIQITTTNSIYDIKATALATLACKAAVKGNDRLTEQEARAIIEELLRLENPFTCPHGRPTIVEISKSEMESMFKRI